MNTIKEIINGIITVISIISFLVLGFFIVIYYFFVYIVKKINKFRRWF